MAPPARRGNGDAAASLTGGGPSQVGVYGAMRARDVSRATEDDLASAERLVQVSRRPPRFRPTPVQPPRRGDTRHESDGSVPDRS